MTSGRLPRTKAAELLPSVDRLVLSLQSIKFVFVLQDQTKLIVSLDPIKSAISRH
jgi:hypothetical protein